MESRSGPGKPPSGRKPAGIGCNVRWAYVLAIKSVGTANDSDDPHLLQKNCWTTLFSSFLQPLQPACCWDSTHRFKQYKNHFNNSMNKGTNPRTEIRDGSPTSSLCQWTLSGGRAAGDGKSCSRRHRERKWWGLEFSFVRCESIIDDALVFRLGESPAVQGAGDTTDITPNRSSAK